jgi:hypothetical protein
MVKLPKSIIAKYGITKKAWAVFRKSRGKKQKKTAHRAAPKKSGKHTRKTTTNGGKKMPKRRKHIRHSVRRAGRRIKSAMSGKPMAMVTMAATAAAGGVVSQMVMDKTPGIKTQSAGVKTMIQGGIGLAAIFFSRNRHIKSLGAGAVIAAAMSAAKSVMAGPSAGSRRLTPTEMARITGGQMNIPLPGTMGVPMASAPGNAGFNRGGFGS